MQVYREDNQTNKDYSKLPRIEKLYILSQVCIYNSVTPNDSAFIGLIIRVCTSKLGISKDKAKEYADNLKSAYEADQWEGLARSHQPEQDEQPLTQTPQTFEPYTPILTTLNLNFKSSAPINHIEKQLVFTIPEYTPKTIAAVLYRMAQNNDFNGVGRIHLSEARYTLDDKTLKPQDITQLITKYYPKAECETRPGNIILVYFEGKQQTKAQREPVIQPATVILKPEVYLIDDKTNFENPEEYNTDKSINVGEIEENINGEVVEEED
jgi:hypothetical protein